MLFFLIGLVWSFFSVFCGLFCVIGWLWLLFSSVVIWGLCWWWLFVRCSVFCGSCSLCLLRWRIVWLERFVISGCGLFVCCCLIVFMIS